MPRTGWGCGFHQTKAGCKSARIQPKNGKDLPFYPSLTATLWVVFSALFLLPLSAQPADASDAVEESTDSLTSRDAWRGLDEAVRLYQEGEFEQAATLFQHLRQQAPEGEFDPDAVRLAEARAWMQSGDPAKTLETLEGVEGFEVDRLQAETRILEGNAAYQIAEQALSQQDPAAAKENAERALERFRNALSVDPRNETAAHNLELTQRFVEQIPEPPPQENEEDQENDQQEEQEDSQDQEQQQQQDSQEQQQQDSEDQEQQPEQDSQEQQEDQESQDQPEQDQPDSDKASSEEQEQPSPEDPDSSNRSEPTEQEIQEFSEEQARQLLDTYDEQERRQRRQFLEQRVRTIPVEKDW